jgi:hypothetical protein
MSMPNVVFRMTGPVPPQVQHQPPAPSAAPDSEPMALALSAESGREPASVAPAQAVWAPPTTANASRTDMISARLATEAADAAGAAQRKAWRLPDVMRALGTGPAAEMLIEKADLPGPVQPGSLLEAVKMFRGLIPPPRRHPDMLC